MDPPEFRTSRSRRTRWAPSGPESRFTIKLVNDRGGPSPFGERFAFAPANASHRALFQSDEGHTKALQGEAVTQSRDPEQPRPRARRETPPGRVNREGDIPNLKRMRSAFPSESPGAEL